MPNVVTIDRRDVVALIEEVASRLTAGDVTEAVALPMRRLRDRDMRVDSLFGAPRGSVRFREDMDLLAPILDVVADAETGRAVTGRPTEGAMSFEALVGIVGQRWISQGNLAIGTASVGTEGLSIGPTCFGTEAQVSLSGDRLTIIREGWRLDAYRRYRPLVYYAAFGRDEVFDCLRLALASLFEFGAYDGEVLLLTDRAHETWTDGLDPAIRDRVTVRIVEAQDMLDWMLARYRIAAMAEFAAYRPLLYLDIDVVANAPLTRLLQRLAVSTLLHAPAENSVMHPADYYGASLLAADGVAVPAERPGFSAGIMGFPDLATAEPLFALVPDLAEAYARRIGSRTRFACFDQPFANYAAVKGGGVELRLLREFVDNRWFWLDRPTARRGLVHFTGGADKPGEKRAAMAAYLGSLRAG